MLTLVPLNVLLLFVALLRSNLYCTVSAQGCSNSTPCTAGNCCSQYGWCGAGTDSNFCGEGCVVGAGDCWLDPQFGVLDPANPNANQSDMCGPALPCACGTNPWSCRINNCVVGGTISISFDDGPGDYFGELLDILDTIPSVKVTFYLNGPYKDIGTDQYNQWIRRAYLAGHQIASHTFYHIDLQEHSEQDIVTDIRLLEATLGPLLDNQLPQYIRPPYGSSNPGVLRLLRALNYSMIIGWDVDTDDWMKPDNPDLIFNRFVYALNNTFVNATNEQTPTTNAYASTPAADAIRNSISDNYSDYQIPLKTLPLTLMTLQHDFVQETVQLIPKIVYLLQSLNYSLVTVAECMGNVAPKYRPFNPSLYAGIVLPVNQGTYNGGDSSSSATSLLLLLPLHPFVISILALASCLFSREP